jgi:hypothetical protein
MNTVDRIARMRAAQNKAAQSATKPATKPAPQSAAKPTKAPPAVVKHTCGREQPLAAIAGTPCLTCLSQRRRDRAARKHAKRQVKHPEKVQTPRLPDGAAFTVAYDAATETWTGSLTVEGHTFTGSASGVFKLLAQLDRQYQQQEPGSGN